jgi:triosephosphate isomerase
LKTPLLLVNFKTYIEATGKKSVDLAKIAEQVAREQGVNIAVAPQFSDLKPVSEVVDIPVFSQHIDPIRPGPFTGHVLAEAVRSAGAAGTLINHSERRIKISEIEETLEMARSAELTTIVCANTAGVGAAVAALNPNMIAIEPPELIGSGVAVSKAQPELITKSVRRIREVNNTVEILCGAGVSYAEDVRSALILGTDGVLVASSVVKNEDPKKLLQEMAGAMLEQSILRGSRSARKPTSQQD